MSSRTPRVYRGPVQRRSGVLSEVVYVSDRPLGTMVTYGYPGIELDDELALARLIGASLLEILPEWSRLPDPALVRRHVADRGLSIHSAHGCLGRANDPRPARRPGSE